VRGEDGDELLSLCHSLVSRVVNFPEI